jgi:DNA-binding FadR family transcriptional regulator
MSGSARPAAPIEGPDPSLEAVFAPVRSQTAFEETVDRLGTAIRLGLLAPGTQLPPERELCDRLGIARSTLRQALIALGESGHLHAVRGRGGGTFIADPQPPAAPPSAEAIADWRDICDRRIVLETGVALLAAERIEPGALAQLDELAHALEATTGDFDLYRRLDVRFHVTIAEATGSARVLADVTQVQGEMTGLISLIAHPPGVLASSNLQHRKVLAALRDEDGPRAAAAMADHVCATAHVLAGLLPAP